ncbi:MAG: pyridoxal-phosphate dependent enzyme [Chitinophagaceae bacterium]|nr:MAG: pyridoxal-phosphate dependent enzyme [Chitinophagaceae bacterium]
MLFDIHNIIFDDLKSEFLERKEISLAVARLDKIHPVVSGNKLFKLHYFLEAFQSGSYKSIQTFGGAYSNHLVATAFACQYLNIPCTGIIRGEEPRMLSSSLQQCLSYGMGLQFVNRSFYAGVAHQQPGDSNILIIPEGGFHPLGAKGASLIMDSITSKNATHVCLPVGTATTLAGIAQKIAADQTLIAIPVLKGFNDVDQRLTLLNGKTRNARLDVWPDYHFGGYAKYTSELIGFMNNIFRQYQLPTDFVYTGKMMFGIFDAISKDRFQPGAKIMCMHTGGLQGNASLPKGSLIF